MLPFIQQLKQKKKVKWQMLLLFKKYAQEWFPSRLLTACRYNTLSLSSLYKPPEF